MRRAERYGVGCERPAQRGSANEEQLNTRMWIVGRHSFPRAGPVTEQYLCMPQPIARV
jgi:hypothetical protein